MMANYPSELFALYQELEDEGLTFRRIERRPVERPTFDDGPICFTDPDPNDDEHVERTVCDNCGREIVDTGCTRPCTHCGWAASCDE